MRRAGPATNLRGTSQFRVERKNDGKRAYPAPSKTAFFLSPPSASNFSSHWCCVASFPSFTSVARSSAESIELSAALLEDGRGSARRRRRYGSRDVEKEVVASAGNAAGRISTLESWVEDRSLALQRGIG